MSKFKDLMAQARQREAEPEPDEAPEEAAQLKPSKDGPAPARRTSNRVNVQPEAEAEPVLRRRGRPAGPAGGKRSHPDYEQVSAYLPRQMHREIRLALLQSEVQTGQKREFSTLVEELLATWLQQQEYRSK